MGKYIDFQVAPYALPQVCEALFNNGIHDGCITMEDNEIHVRWKYDINRYHKQTHKAQSGEESQSPRIPCDVRNLEDSFTC